MAQALTQKLDSIPSNGIIQLSEIASNTLRPNLRPPVAALYVQPDGCYADLPGVDLWDQARDARLYAGPHPVVAHPPCQRWGRYWHGSPRKPHQFKLGDDGGCFAAALMAVRRWGGVLEHPADSHAWAAFGIARPPRSGGWVSAGEWVRADGWSGWTCCVDQGHYGHISRKTTWLYAVGTDLPELEWSRFAWEPDPKEVARIGFRAAQRNGALSRPGLVNRQALRAATPPAFRDLLLSIAASAVAPSPMVEQIAQQQQGKAGEAILPHMCRDGHTEIRHALSDDDERCPVCRERGRADFAEDQIITLTAERDGLQAIVLADDAKAVAEYEWERANKLADDNLRLTGEIANLREALLGVVRIADRKTVEFDRARAVLSVSFSSPTPMVPQVAQQQQGKAGVDLDEGAIDASCEAAWAIARPYIARNLRKGADPGPFANQSEDVRVISRLEVVASVEVYLALTKPSTQSETSQSADADRARLMSAVESAVESLRFYHADGIADALDAAVDDFLNPTPSASLTKGGV